MTVDDYYAPWEWQPIDRMPDGCIDVTVRFKDGRRHECCACDYWWSLQRDEEQPIDFRLT